MRYICEYQIDVLSTFFKSIFNYKLVCLFLTIYHGKTNLRILKIHLVLIKNVFFKAVIPNLAFPQSVFCYKGILRW